MKMAVGEGIEPSKTSLYKGSDTQQVPVSTISPPHSTLLLFPFLNQFHLFFQSIFRQFTSSFIQFLNNFINIVWFINGNNFIIFHDNRLARFIALIILVTPIPPPNRGIKSCARNSLSSSSTLSLPNRLNNNSAYPPSDMV